MLNQTYKKIKSLKIQGATNISHAAILAIQDTIKKEKNILQARKKLISARPTEPELENYLNYITKFHQKHTKTQTLTEIRHLLKAKKQLIKIIHKNGSKLIKKGNTIFTHCHSSLVIGSLKQAKKKIKKVYNTETRPSFQGRMTSKDLAKLKIPVTHIVDSASRIAIKKSDLMLIGADSITYNRVFNKIGSELMALTARDYHVPVYVCASLWKFNPHKETIEERPSSEIWRAPKGVKVRNYAFEKISFKLIKGIVCEEGILKPKKFVKEARKMLL